MTTQGRREPNVGPGPVQIWRISSFVNSKTAEKMPQFCPNYDVISKKRVFTEILMVFPVEIRWSSKKRGVSGLTCWFLSIISMGPSRARGPSAGPAGPWVSKSPWAPGSLYPTAPPPLGGPMTTYCTIFQWQFTSISQVFTWRNTFEKN